MQPFSYSEKDHDTIAELHEIEILEDAIDPLKDNQQLYMGIRPHLNDNNRSYNRILKTEPDLSEQCKKMVELEQSLDTLEIGKPIDQVIMNSAGVVTKWPKRCPL